MEILYLGEDAETVQQIRENLREEDSIHRFDFCDLKFWGCDIKEFDIIIFDDTTMDSDILNVIKLNCHLTKPVLAVIGDISAAEENRIWGMGVTDIIEVPFTNEECRKKIDSIYRWKWYYDRCKYHNKKTLVEE